MIYEILLSDIFKDCDCIKLEKMSFFRLDLTVDFDIYEFEYNYFINNPEHLIFIIHNTISNQYLIFIREIGVYNIISKCKLELGHTKYYDWKNFIYKLEDGSYWNDKNLNNMKFIHSYFVIKNNPNLLKLLLFDLYELLFNQFNSKFTQRIDMLLKELHHSEQNNLRAKQIIENNYNDLYFEGVVCKNQIPLQEEDINQD